MLKRYQRMIGGTYRIVDACVIGGVWLISYWLRFYVPIIEVTKGFPAFETYASLTPLVMILWSMVLSSFGAYRSRRMLRRTHEAHLIIKAHIIALLLFIALTYMFSEYRYSRVVMGYFGLLGAFLLVFFRLAGRNALRYYRARGYQTQAVLGVGDGATLIHLIHRIDRFPELGLRFVGVAAANPSEKKDVHGKPVLGGFDDIPHLIRQHRVSQLLIALPRKDYPALDSILNQIRDETVDIRLVPDIHEYVTLGCEVEDFEGFPIVNINDSPLDGWGAVLKRATDLVLTTVGVILISPLLLFIALAIKFSSRGPILYSQERMGLDGRTFTIYKFRSMKVDAETQTGAVWAKEDDERRTSIGAFLRSTNLDELPQLWNVLKGDMSLVGPRPERPVFVDQFRGEIPHYMLRHKVKAGMTGWAQINGWRGNTSLKGRIEADLYYIRNWSYFLDWKILFLTFVRGNKNAY